MKKSNKKIIILTMLLLLFCLVLVYIKSTRVTKMEKMKIEDVSNELMGYMYNVDNKEYNQVEKYLLFALDYSLNENNKDTLTLREIKDFIDSKFDNCLEEIDYMNIGITPEMANRDIHFDYDTNTYTINKKELTDSDIADIPIYSYAIDKIRKSSANKYIVTYYKYKVDKPHKILEFYDNKNLPDDGIPNSNGEIINIEIENITTDTTDITKYLHGEASRGILNKYLTKECLQSIGEKQGELKVYYVVKDSKIIVDKIKTE